MSVAARLSFDLGLAARRCGARWRAAAMWTGLVLAQAPAVPAGAAVFAVTNTNDSGAGSLRDAIASANGAAGADEITFALAGCPCVIALASPLVVSDALTLTGPGTSRLAVDGGDAVRVLQASAPLTVSDLTLRNGNAGANPGGALYATGATLALTRVAVESSAGTQGGGAFAQGPATVADCVFEGNAASTDGGGLYAPGGLTLTGSQFVNNQVTAHKGYGGGGGLMAFGATAVSTTAFIGNTSGDWGGGAYLADFTPLSLTLLTDVQFQSNTAEDGGGGGLFLWFDATLTRVEASANSAGYRGGGIYGGYAGNYGLQVVGGRLVHNSAAGGGGFYSDGDIEMDGTEVTGNTSTSGNGGGVWALLSAVVSHATISENVVLAGGNSGGLDTGANLTITSSTLSDNQTFTGGGGGSGAGGDATVTDCRYTGNTADGVGGGLLAYGSVQVSGSTFSGNTAEHNWGGGVFANQAATVTDSTFSDNTSGYAGGGLAAQLGATQVTGGRFEGNQAALGGWGGAIYGGATVEVDGTEFLTNHAEANGGAVAAGGAASVTAALLEGNSAAGSGGAIYAGSDLDLDRARCIDNEGNLGGAAFQGSGGGQIVNSLFARNRAVTGLGEALALQPSGTQSILHSTLATHPTQAPGSALYVNGGTVELRSSIVTSHAQGILRDAGAVNADYNLFDGNGVDTQGASIASDHPVAGAPVFVDPANDDYHLALGSAAIDAGPDVGVAADFDGEARPEGAGFDLGFDEVNPAAPGGCPTTPPPGCRAAERDALQIKVAADPAKARFTLKHARDAGPLAQADFGDPVAGGNAYQLCLYDESAGAPALLAEITVQGVARDRKR